MESEFTMDNGRQMHDIQRDLKDLNPQFLDLRVRKSDLIYILIKLKLTKIYNGVV